MSTVVQMNAGILPIKGKPIMGSLLVCGRQKAVCNFSINVS
jgi:hypothetical protein